MGNSQNDSLTTEYHEVYLGHEIFVEANRDQYRGGFEWAVCRDGVELTVGLDFKSDVALQQAKIFVDSIVQK